MALLTRPSLAKLSSPALSSAAALAPSLCSVAAWLAAAGPASASLPVRSLRRVRASATYSVAAGSCGNTCLVRAHGSGLRAHGSGLSSGRL